VKILILGRPNGLEAKVIDDQKIGLGQGLEAAFEGASGPGGLEQPQQFALGGKQNVVALADGAVAEGLGDMAFSVMRSFT
jgi:hypothetical protein